MKKSVQSDSQADAVAAVLLVLLAVAQRFADDAALRAAATPGSRTRASSWATCRGR